MEFDPSFSIWVYALLFGTGFCAGLVDAMAGGGGLITIPVLLNLGFPGPPNSACPSSSFCPSSFLLSGTS